MKAPESLVLYGVGSALLADYVETCKRLNIRISACVKNYPAHSYSPEGLPFFDLSEETEFGLPSEIMGDPFAVPMFGPGSRHVAYQQAKSIGFKRMATLIDPTAILPSNAEIGEGCYLNAGVTMGAACILGRGVILNRSVSIGHDCKIADFASLGPGVTMAGEIHVGRGAVIGVGAVILPQIKIGENAVVAAGSVVTKDVAANTMVAGNPFIVKKTEIEGYQGRGVPLIED